MTADLSRRLRLGRVAALLLAFGAFCLIAHFVIYRQTSVSAFVDHPEFYYNRFVIRDSSGHAVRDVSLATGFWTYITAITGVVLLCSGIAGLIVFKTCKH
jgi:hypothetical protein